MGLSSLERENSLSEVIERFLPKADPNPNNYGHSPSSFEILLPSNCDHNPNNYDHSPSNFEILQKSLYIQIRVLCVAFNEAFARSYFVAHEHGEDFIGFDRFFD